MTNRLTLAIGGTLLVSCAATGVKVSDDQLQAFRRGESTADQVVAALGQPTSRMRANDGTVTLQYVYAEAKIRAASYVPVVGLFAGGSDIRTTMATLKFGPDGKLMDLTTSETQYGNGTGAAAGTVTPTPVPQPR